MSNNVINYFKALISERDNFSSINKNRLLKVNLLNRENLLKGIEY
jgi:hypothetical protein